MKEGQLDANLYNFDWDESSASISFDHLDMMVRYHFLSKAKQAIRILRFTRFNNFNLMTTQGWQS